MYRSHVLVCGGTGCTSSGSPKIMEALKYEIKRQGLEEEVAVVETGCHGLCALGPIMIVYPDATFYSMVQVNDIPEIVSEHLLKGRVVTRLLYQETVSPTGGIKALIDTDFYKKQHRIALRNCGVINPENIEEYIGTGGYQALGKVLTEMTPDDVIQTLLDAGLRAAAARVSQPVLSGSSVSRTTQTRNMCAATPTRATPAHSWTVLCWKAILMPFWRQWLLRVTQSDPTRAIFMSAPSTPSLWSV